MFIFNKILALIQISRHQTSYNSAVRSSIEFLLSTECHQCFTSTVNTYIFQTALPLSAILFRGGKHVQPQCPPRLDVQCLNSCSWSRVPISSLGVHTLKLSEIRGWSMLCEDPGEQIFIIHLCE